MEKLREDFLDKIISIYGEKYIFIHDHRHIKYDQYTNYRPDVTNLINDNKFPVFHPNFNYYSFDKKHKYYNLWSKELIRYNLLDYGLILENAEEISIIDSSFSNLCPYLDLSKVKYKQLKTYIDYLDYHPMGDYDTWKIINPTD